MLRTQDGGHKSPLPPSALAVGTCCFGLWFPRTRGFTLVPSDLTAAACSHRRPACHSAVGPALETLGLVSAGWFSLRFQRGGTAVSLCPGPPTLWASAVHIHLLWWWWGCFSSYCSLRLYLSLTMHIIPFEERQRECVHMVTLCPLLPRTCGFSDRGLASQETPLHKASRGTTVAAP